MEGGLGRIMRYAAESARRSLLEPVAAKLDAEESEVREVEERREAMRSTYMEQVKEDVARATPEGPMLDRGEGEGAATDPEHQRQPGAARSTGRRAGKQEQPAGGTAGSRHWRRRARRRPGTDRANVQTPAKLRHGWRRRARPSLEKGAWAQTRCPRASVGTPPAGPWTQTYRPSNPARREATGAWAQTHRPRHPVKGKGA